MKLVTIMNKPLLKFKPKIKPCIFCNSNETLWTESWVDRGLKKGQTKYFSFRLCKKCYLLEFPEDIDKIVNCWNCHKDFVGKEDWMKNCLDCWKLRRFGK